MRSIIQIAAILLLSGVAAQLPAQRFHFVEHPLFERYDPIETLSLFEDDKGLIWTGTEKGLYYFDGISFRNVELAGAENKWITAIYQDQNGLMWIGSKSGEIFTLEGFERALPVEWEEGTPKVEIKGFAEDGDGLLWIATYGEGLYVISDHLVNISVEDGLPSNDIYDLDTDRWGCIWEGTDNGIAGCTFESNTKTIRAYGKAQGIPDEIVKSIEIREDGRALLGTHQSGVIGFSPDEEKFYEVTAGEWKYGEITDMVEFKGADIWIGTKNRGLIRYDYVQDQYLMVEGLKELDNTGIHAMIRGTEDIAWISGNMIPLLQTNRKFEFYSAPGLNLQSIGCGVDNCLWLGTQEGLYKMNFENGKFKLEEVKGFQGKNITSLYFRDRTTLWIGTFEQGLFLLDLEEMRIRQFTESNGLTNNNVLSISGDQRSIWLATLGGVSRLFDQGVATAGTIPKIESFGAESELGSNYIYQSFVDKEGTVWFATDGDGISYYRNGQFRTIMEADSTKIQSIYSITEDSRGRIWFSTSSSGIFIKDRDRGIIHLSPEEMQFSPDILSMQPSRNNSVVVVHPIGLDEIHNDLWSITYYGKEVGLQDFQPNLNSSFTDHLGNIWIGSRGTLVKFAYLPDGNIHEPELVMREIKLFNQHIEAEQNRKFNHNQNFLSFAFSGLWYTHPDEVFYKYKLEGYEMDWNYTSDQRISYSHLPPGEYTFRIAAVHHENPIQENEYYSWEFSIAKPYYMQFWFLALVAIVITLVIYSFVKYREMTMEKEAAYRKAKLESELQTLKNQINPHFLFNSFNTLMNYIEEEPETAVKYVENLSDFYRKILQYRDKDLVPVEEELELISNYYYLLKRRFGGNLTMEINVDGVEAYIPPLSLQILIENAVKHNVVSRSRPLHISINKTGEDYLVISNNLQVKTNGRENSTGFGLDNISKRYKLLTNKEVIIENTGKEFIVNMPLIKNGKNENIDH